MSRTVHNFAAVWERTTSALDESFPTLFKLKADINRNIALSIKNAIPGYGSYTFGADISDFGRYNKLACGLQLDLDP